MRHVLDDSFESWCAALGERKALRAVWVHDGWGEWAIEDYGLVAGRICFSRVPGKPWPLSWPKLLIVATRHSSSKLMRVLSICPLLMSTSPTEVNLLAEQLPCQRLVPLGRVLGRGAWGVRLEDMLLESRVVAAALRGSDMVEERRGYERGDE